MFGLKEEHIDAINNCFGQYPGIEQVMVYGSRAKGNYRPGSDIDLTIVGHIDFGQMLRLETEIDDLLLPYKLDLSLLHTISDPDLLDHIQRVGQVFYDKQLVSEILLPQN